MCGSCSARILLAAAAFCVLFLPARSICAGTPQSYDKSGTVIKIAHDASFVYEIESDDNMYTMACSRTKLVQLRAPQCEWNGRPMGVGDQVTFRIEGDDAFIPVSSDNEERLVVLMTETKLLPPLPDAPKGLEGAIVLGLGYAPEGQSVLTPMLSQLNPPAASTSTSSSGSMAPVVAVPTTGGAPVVVIPTAPATGGVVTGVPATGGAPTTAIPVSPTTSSAASSP